MCYNSVMKKLLLYGLICLLTCIPAGANEITEDYMDIAKNYCLIGDYPNAISYLNRILAIEPNYTQVRDIIVMLNRFTSQDRKAYATRQNSSIYNAMVAKYNGDSTLTLEYLKKAANANGFLFYNFLGEYYKELGNYNMAIAAFNSALEYNPDFVQAYLAVALCRYEMGDYEGVIPPITKFLYFNQQESFAYMVRAKAYMMMGRNNDAETEIVTALALNDDIMYRFIHGIILCKKGQFAQAKNILEPLTDTISNADIYKYLGIAYLGLKDYNDAVLNLDKAIVLSDDDKELEAKYNEAKAALRSAASNSAPQQNNSSQQQQEPKTQVQESDSENFPADYYLNDDYDSEEDINGTYDENQKK